MCLGMGLLVSMVLPLPVSALNCVGVAKDNPYRGRLMPFYISDREAYVFTCDTMTVEYGDTTAIWGEGTTSFRWDKDLDTCEKVLRIQGVLKGEGRVEIGGDFSPKGMLTRWGGIIMDSCASTEFEHLVLTGATTPLALKSTHVSVGKLDLEGSGALLLPDRSKFSVHPKSDYLERFNASVLPGMQVFSYNCPDAPHRTPFAVLQTPAPTAKASSWSTSDVLYWTSVVGIGILSGLMIMMAQKK